MRHSGSLDEFIKKLYKSLKIEEASEIDITAIARGLHIKLHYFNYESESFYFENVYRIFLNKNISIHRQWEEFARELCFVLFHRNILNRNKVGIKDFIYHFCVPQFMLDKIELPFCRMEAIAYISKLFNVGIVLAAERFKDLNGNQNRINAF